MMNKLADIKEYASKGLNTGMIDASSHQMVQMLMEGVIDRIKSAQHALNYCGTKDANEHISAAIAIVDGLRASLDIPGGGEIALNLNALYDYMEMRLVEVLQGGASTILANVRDISNELLDAWNSIPEELR